MPRNKVTIALFSTTIIGSILTWALSFLSVGLATAFAVLIQGLLISVAYWRLRKALATTAKRSERILTTIEAASNRSAMSESNVLKAINSSPYKQLDPNADRAVLVKEIGLMNGAINSLVHQLNEIAIAIDFNPEPNRRR